MPKKKSKLSAPQTLVQIISEKYDKRTKASTKAAADNLFSNFSLRDIKNTEAFAGLSEKKLNELRKKSKRKGGLYSPQLRDLFKEAFNELQTGDYEESEESGLKFFKNEKALNKHQNDINKSWEIASAMLPSYKQAENWYKNSGNGAEYFAIVRRKWGGKEVFFIVDIDPNRSSRIRRKGKKSFNEYATQRAQQLWQNYKDETKDYKRKE